jgi:hypothetical protein
VELLQAARLLSKVNDNEGGDVAESLFVHFAAANWDVVIPWLDCRDTRSGDSYWYYPEPDYTLLLYEYPDLLGEYELEELDKLRVALGGLPSMSLCLELRRSRGDQACDAATALCIELLQEF